MANDQTTISIPAPLTRKGMTPRDLVEAAEKIALSDDDTAMLPNWAALAIGNPRTAPAKSIHAALMRLDYARLEQLRVSISWVIDEYGYRLLEGDNHALTTPLPVNELDRNAKNQLLTTLRRLNEIIKLDSEYRQPTARQPRVPQTEEQPQPSDEIPEMATDEEALETVTTKTPRKRATKKAAAPKATDSERPALRAV